MPPPPVLVPGKGFKELEQVVDSAFPELELKDEIYAQGLLEFILNFLKLDESVLDNPLQPQIYASSLSKLVSGNVDSESQEIIKLL